VSKELESKPGADQAEFIRRVEEQSRRKLKAKARATQTIWSGFGMFGLIGWSIVTPTLIGIALGVWLDRKHVGGPHSWTLALLVAGLILGCLNAWHWVAKEDREMREEDKANGGTRNGK